MEATMDAISGKARRELVRAVGARYRAGSREEKRRILDEFVAVTRWHRKHAIRMLNVAGAEREIQRAPGSASTTTRSSRRCWSCGRSVHALLAAHLASR
jgi:hypothetical protein